MSSVSICRPEAGVVHCGGGHQSAAEPQTCSCRVPAETPAQLLPDQRELHPPKPASKRQLPSLQHNRRRPFDRQRAGLFLQIGPHLAALSCLGCGQSYRKSVQSHLHESKDFLEHWLGCIYYFLLQLQDWPKLSPQLREGRSRKLSTRGRLCCCRDPDNAGANELQVWDALLKLCTNVECEVVLVH